MTTTTKTATKKTGATKKTTTAKKPASDALLLKKNGVRANLPAMLSALEVMGVKIDAAKARPDEVISAVRAKVASNSKGKSAEELLSCNDETENEDGTGAVLRRGCGEISTDATDFCPFCGMGSAAFPVAEGADPKGGAPAPAAAKTNGAAKPNGKAATTTALAKREEEPSGDVVVPTGEALVKMTGDLDEQVGKVKTLAKDIAGNSYDLGLVIRDVHERQLWKVRVYDGKPAKSFKDFVEKELPISRALAYRLMDIVKDFTRETFLKVGATKLGLISGIDDEEARKAALNQAEAGKSARDVAREAAPHKGKSGGKGGSTKREEGERAPAPKKANEITLLAKVNGKPVLYSFRSAKTNRALAAHADDAYAAIPIGDDVVLQVALKTDRAGEKILGVTAKFVRAE